MIVFLDHFDEAAQEVAEWLTERLLGCHLQEAARFANLWIVVAGRQVILGDATDDWSEVAETQELAGLQREAIETYWIERRSRSAVDLEDAIRESGGNPQLLVMRASDAGVSLHGEGYHG